MSSNNGLPTNAVRDRLDKGEMAVGMLLRMSRSPEIARLAKACGHDFVFIDTQHAVFSLETISSINQVALGCGIASLVRVRSYQDPDIAVILDSGATGIVFPDINTATEARIAVDTCKYAPLGRRSLTHGHAVFDFETKSAADTVRILNAHTLVVCMIETLDGLANVEEIAAVEGVDVLLIGLTDLLYNYGTPGELESPRVMEAVDRVTNAAKANGKVAGVGGDTNPDRQREYIRKGMRFLPLQTDISLLMTSAKMSATNLRSLLPASS